MKTKREPEVDIENDVQENGKPKPSIDSIIKKSERERGLGERKPFDMRQWTDDANIECLKYSRLDSLNDIAKVSESKDYSVDDKIAIIQMICTHHMSFLNEVKRIEIVNGWQKFKTKR